MNSARLQDVTSSSHCSSIVPQRCAGDQRWHTHTCTHHYLKPRLGFCQSMCGSCLSYVSDLKTSLSSNFYRGWEVQGKIINQKTQWHCLGIEVLLLRPYSLLHPPISLAQALDLFEFQVLTQDHFLHTLKQPKYTQKYFWPWFREQFSPLYC